MASLNIHGENIHEAGMTRKESPLGYYPAQAGASVHRERLSQQEVMYANTSI